MHSLRKRIPTGLLLALCCAAAALPLGAADDHAGHDHAEHDRAANAPAKPPAPAAPAVAPAGEHAHEHAGEHAGHADEHHDAHTAKAEVVHLSPAALQAAGLVLEQAGPGVLRQGWVAPGEIQFNADSLTRITPRIAGQVTQIPVAMGAVVSKGQLLAVLQSSELGNIKIEFFTAQVNVELAQAEKTRAQLVLDNTTQLLQALAAADTANTAAPEIKTAGLGEIKSRLLTAFSAVRLARAAADRAAMLKLEQLISTADLEQRNQELESARAQYAGACEEARLQAEIVLLQADRALRLATLAAQNAERKLHIIGFTDEQVQVLNREKDEQVARYEIRAQSAGTIVERNLAVGEQIDANRSAFVVADLTQVWCSLQIYSHQLAQVHVGDPILLAARDGAQPREGKLISILPTLNEKSRTAVAIAELDNADRALRPGQFISAWVETARIDAPVTVPVGALLSYENRPIVFVASADGDAFEARAVTVGRQDATRAQILGGLKAGETVVVKNSFVLKAELGKAGAVHEH